MDDKKDIFDYIQPKKTDLPDASYFENLADSIITEQKKEQPEVKVIPLYKRPILWMSAAAAVIAVIITVQFGAPVSDESNSLAELDKIPSSELMAYVDDNIEEFDIELIAEVISTEQLTTTNTTAKEDENGEPIEEQAPNTIEQTIQPEPAVSFDEISTDEILQYLQEEELELEDLEEESFI